MGNSLGVDVTACTVRVVSVATSPQRPSAAPSSTSPSSASPSYASASSSLSSLSSSGDGILRPSSSALSPSAGAAASSLASSSFSPASLAATPRSAACRGSADHAGEEWRAQSRQRLFVHGVLKKLLPRIELQRLHHALPCSRCCSESRPSPAPAAQGAEGAAGEEAPARRGRHQERREGEARSSAEAASEREETASRAGRAPRREDAESPTPAWPPEASRAAECAGGAPYEGEERNGENGAVPCACTSACSSVVYLWSMDWADLETVLPRALPFLERGCRIALTGNGCFELQKLLQRHLILYAFPSLSPGAAAASLSASASAGGIPSPRPSAAAAASAAPASAAPLLCGDGRGSGPSRSAAAGGERRAPLSSFFPLPAEDVAAALHAESLEERREKARSLTVTFERESVCIIEAFHFLMQHFPSTVFRYEGTRRAMNEAPTKGHEADEFYECPLTPEERSAFYPYLLVNLKAGVSFHKVFAAPSARTHLYRLRDEQTLRFSCTSSSASAAVKGEAEEAEALEGSEDDEASQKGAGGRPPSSVVCAVSSPPSASASAPLFWESSCTSQRIGGSTIGGATFMGLCRLLLPGEWSPKDLLQLAATGDNRVCDMLVRDIYGGGYDAIGLKPCTIASTFGKLQHIPLKFLRDYAIWESDTESVAPRRHRRAARSQEARWRRRRDWGDLEPAGEAVCPPGARRPPRVSCREAEPNGVGGRATRAAQETAGAVASRACAEAGSAAAREGVETRGELLSSEATLSRASVDGVESREVREGRSPSREAERRSVDVASETKRKDAESVSAGNAHAGGECGAAAYEASAEETEGEARGNVDPRGDSDAWEGEESDACSCCSCCCASSGSESCSSGARGDLDADSWGSSVLEEEDEELSEEDSLSGSPAEGGDETAGCGATTRDQKSPFFTFSSVSNSLARQGTNLLKTDAPHSQDVEGQCGTERETERFSRGSFDADLIKLDGDGKRDICLQYRRPTGPDIVRSLLTLMSFNVAQQAYLHAALHGLKRIALVGFLLDVPAFLASLQHSVRFWSKNEVRVFFCSLSPFLGALGASLAHAWFLFATRGSGRAVDVQGDDFFSAPHSPSSLACSACGHASASAKSKCEKSPSYLSISCSSSTRTSSPFYPSDPSAGLSPVRHDASALPAQSAASHRAAASSLAPCPQGVSSSSASSPGFSSLSSAAFSSSLFSGSPPFSLAGGDRRDVRVRARASGCGVGGDAKAAGEAKRPAGEEGDGLGSGVPRRPASSRALSQPARGSEDARVHVSGFHGAGEGADGAEEERDGGHALARGGAHPLALLPINSRQQRGCVCCLLSPASSASSLEASAGSAEAEAAPLVGDESRGSWQRPLLPLAFLHSSALTQEPGLPAAALPACATDEVSPAEALSASSLFPPIFRTLPHPPFSPATPTSFVPSDAPFSTRAASLSLPRSSRSFAASSSLSASSAACARPSARRAPAFSPSFAEDAHELAASPASPPPLLPPPLLPPPPPFLPPVASCFYLLPRREDWRGPEKEHAANAAVHDAERLRQRER